jgi:hypothetical protein
MGLSAKKRSKTSPVTILVALPRVVHNSKGSHY